MDGGVVTLVIRTISKTSGGKRELVMYEHVLIWFSTLYINMIIETRRIQPQLGFRPGVLR